MDADEKKIEGHIASEISAGADVNGGQVRSGNGKKDSKQVISGRALQRQKKLRFQPVDVAFQIEENRHQYYKELGGAEMHEDKLPRAICVADEIESRVKEIKSMFRAVSQHTSDRAVLQKLPRHMRRRAASHNRKRLPRRLHQLAAEINKPQDGSKPVENIKRKKRRRKHNLQTEYAKRAGKQGWLETHTWHAKRFHMTETTDDKFSQWRNRVALYPNDKCFKACYRAVAKHCLIQDLSYLCCIKLSGDHRTLINSLEEISNHKFTSAQLEGKEETDILIHTIQSKGIAYCIGPASVMWKPKAAASFREVLLWLHPTILSEVSSLLSTLSSNEKAPFQICDDSGELLRFRLTGPKSSITLLSILRPLNVLPGESKDSELGKWMEKEEMVITKIHDEFVEAVTECHRDGFSREKGDKSYLCSNGIIFPVITNDPRLVLPIDKTTPTLTALRQQIDDHLGFEQRTEKTLKCSEGNPQSCNEKLCSSPLWCQTIKTQVICSRQPDHIVSTRRRQMKAVDKDEDDIQAWKDSLTTPVPIIVIRKLPNQVDKMVPDRDAGKKSDHAGPGPDFASGWDIIIPKQWGTAFWIPLIYHRARAGGLRENQSICLESMKPHFPEDFPDTSSGQQWWEAEAKALCKKHYRKPPAKRSNYSVLAVQSPFKPNWMGLFKTLPPAIERDEHTHSEDASGGDIDEPPTKRQKLNDKPADAKVIEDDVTVKLTETLEKAIGTKEKVCVLRKEEDILQLKVWMRSLMASNPLLNKNDTPHVFEHLDNSLMLVCVGVQSVAKGVPFSRAVLSFPTEQDLDHLCSEITDPYKYGITSVSGPVEEKHWDPYRKERKEMRKLKKLQKKRKASNTEGKLEESNASTSCNRLDKQTVFSAIPTRESIGFVTSGRFVYSHACGVGVGFITLESLKRLGQSQANHCNLEKLFNLDIRSDPKDASLLALMRNVDSTQYRFVKLSLIKPC